LKLDTDADDNDAGREVKTFSKILDSVSQVSKCEFISFTQVNRRIEQGADNALTEMMTLLTIDFGSDEQLNVDSDTKRTTLILAAHIRFTPASVTRNVRYPWSSEGRLGYCVQCASSVGVFISTSIHGNPLLGVNVCAGQPLKHDSRRTQAVH
jgi:hypothetical protein